MSNKDEVEKINYRFEAYHVVPDSPQMEKDVLYAAASLEAKSNGPTSEDLLRVAKINAILPVEVEGFEEFPVGGMGGLIQFPHEARPRAVLMGTRDLMQENGLEMPALLEVIVRTWENEKNTLVWLLGWDAWVRAVLKFAPTVRELANKNAPIFRSVS